MTEQKEYRYEAFISYRHVEPDQAIARKLHGYIENYRIPAAIRQATGRKKMGRVFRDQEELPLSSDLSGDIDAALKQSRWLIVVCSPDLLRSQWCMKEIDTFIALGHADRVRILTVLTRGEPRDSFPEQLCTIERDGQKIPVEPLAADVRANSVRGMIRRLKSEKLRVIAPMLNVSYDELRRRARERRLRLAALALSAMLALALAFTGYTLWQNARVKEQRDIAQNAAVQLLIEKSERSTGDGELSDGAAQALAAYDQSRDMDGRYDRAIGAALEYALYPEPFARVSSLKDNGRIHRGARISPHDRYAACVEGESDIAVYDVASGERLFGVRTPGALYLGNYGFTPEGDCLYTVVNGLVSLISPDTGALIAARDIGKMGYETIPNGVAVGGRAVGRGANDRIALIDLRTGEVFPIEGTGYAGGTDALSGALTMSADGARALVVTDHVALLDLTRGSAATIADSADAVSARFTPDGLFIALKGDTTRFLRTDTLEPVCEARDVGEAAVLSPDGLYLADAVNGTDGVRMLDARTGETLWSASLNSGNTVYSLRFMEDGEYLLASNGAINVYDARTGRVAYTPGESVLTYGFALGRDALLLPLRSGGCVVRLLPHASAVSKTDTYDAQSLYSPDDLFYGSLPIEPSHYAQTYDTGTPRTFSPYVYHVSPDGAYHALLYPDGYVEVYALAQGAAPVRTFFDSSYAMLDAAFYGDVLATAGYQSNVLFYNVKTGELLGSVYAGRQVRFLCFSPDGGKLIAMDEEDNAARVISTDNYRMIMTLATGEKTMTHLLNGTDDQVIRSVGFSPDGLTAAAVLKGGGAIIGELRRDLDDLVLKARTR